jgi:hypothetical protein
VDSTLSDSTTYKVRVSDESDSTVYGESAQFTIEKKSLTVTEPTSSTKWSQGASGNISWSSKGVISYVKIELYKGSTSKQLIVSSTENDGSYTWSAVESTLENGTDYKVRVSDFSAATVYGESAQFTIEAKSITVTKPTSSTYWAKGYSGAVNWTWTGNISYVKIDLYKGTTLKQTITYYASNNGSYTWTVDSALENGTDYKVRVSDYNNAAVYGESVQFEIGPPSITVTEPTASTAWVKGQSGAITWTWKGDFSYVNIDLYKGTTWKQTITTYTSNDGSYTWTTVSSTLENGTDYKVRVSNPYDSTVYGESAQFEIK